MDKRKVRAGGLALAAAIVAGLGALTLWRLVPGEAALPADAVRVPVPSGMEVAFAQSLMDSAGPSGLTARFFFVAPGLAGATGSEAISADMQALCSDFALPRVATGGPQPQQIVISLADRLVPFGQSDAAATQFFEAFGIKTGACIWEVF